MTVEETRKEVSLGTARGDERGLSGDDFGALLDRAA